MRRNNWKSAQVFDSRGIERSDVENIPSGRFLVEREDCRGDLPAGISYKPRKPACMRVFALLTIDLTAAQRSSGMYGRSSPAFSCAGRLFLQSFAHSPAAFVMRFPSVNSFVAPFAAAPALDGWVTVSTGFVIVALISEGRITLADASLLAGCFIAAVSSGGWPTALDAESSREFFFLSPFRFLPCRSSSTTSTCSSSFSDCSAC